jgi:hypothetical protein
MVLVRPLIVLCLMAASCGVGAAGMRYKDEQRFLRLTEEREGYMALAEKAMAMSDKALVFAHGYQLVLDTCLERIYSSPTTEQAVMNIRPKKGGIGGPNTLRGDSRLP